MWPVPLRCVYIHTGDAAVEQQQFSDFLGAVGEGRLPIEPELNEFTIKLPDDLVAASHNIESFVREVFGDPATWQDSRGTAILTPKNADVDAVNNLMMGLFPGQVRLPLDKSSCLILNDTAVPAGLFPLPYLTLSNPSCRRLST